MKSRASRKAFGNSVECSNYRVYIRCRAFIANDKDPFDEGGFPLPPFEIKNANECIFMDPNTGIPKECFMFDGAFCSITPEQWSKVSEVCALSPDSPFFPPVQTQAMMYKHCAEPIVSWVLEGYNASILAYGQTSSGKTHTMMGTPEDQGIMPRLCKALLQGASDAKENVVTSEAISGSVKLQLVDFTMEIAFFEIYNENVLDLLDSTSGVIGNVHRKRKVRSHPSLGVYIDDLTFEPVQTWSQCSKTFAKGSQLRHVAATKMNAESSRSHAVMQIRMIQTEMSELGPLQRISNVYLADLAGSERIKASQVEGDQLKETAQINLSLTTLRRVIDSLITVKKKELVPYRDSMLTWVLSEALGGNAKSCMIATLSPNPLYADESFITLQYANRAKSIVSTVVRNEDQMASLIRKLKEQIVKEQNPDLGVVNLLSSTEQMERTNLTEEKVKSAEMEIERLKKELFASNAELSAIRGCLLKEEEYKSKVLQEKRSFTKKIISQEEKIENMKNTILELEEEKSDFKRANDVLEIEVMRLVEEKRTLRDRLMQEAKASYMPMLQWYKSTVLLLSDSLLYSRRAHLAGSIVTASNNYVKELHNKFNELDRSYRSTERQLESLANICQSQKEALIAISESYLKVKEFLSILPSSRGGPIPCNWTVKGIIHALHNFQIEMEINDMSPFARQFGKRSDARK